MVSQPHESIFPPFPGLKKATITNRVHILKGWSLKGIASNCFRSLVSKKELVLEERLRVVVLSGSPRTPQVIIRGTEQ